MFDFLRLRSWEDEYKLFQTSFSMMPNPLSGAFNCSAGALLPLLLGAEILSLNASLVSNFSFTTDKGAVPVPVNLTGLNFCNVSIEHTHPGQGDSILTQVWLPTDWNGRFMGTGGGGFVTGLFDSALAWAVSRGYSAASTDGGHGATATAESWGLASPNNVNYYQLNNFASVALDDMASLGKAVTRSYYGVRPAYSYWRGCSTGGRQGLMMAQRFPDQYQGILAGAPAINWCKLVPTSFWPQVVMNTLKTYPRPCELAAITEAAITACDGTDGVLDRIISLPRLCKFDAQTLVGTSFSCAGAASTFSQAAVDIAKAAWTGPTDLQGKPLFHGYAYDTDLVRTAGTVCASNGTCRPEPFSTGAEWMRVFLVKNASYDTTTLNTTYFQPLFKQSVQLYGSAISTDDADLSRFRDAGGKLLTWHGLADELIPRESTATYHDRVLASDAGVGDYFRHFEAPGVGHCAGGPGAFPDTIFDSLVRWVENGTAPTSLDAASLPAADGSVSKRALCLYPANSVYIGGNASLASSYTCARTCSI